MPLLTIICVKAAGNRVKSFINKNKSEALLKKKLTNTNDGNYGKMCHQ